MNLSCWTVLCWVKLSKGQNMKDLEYLSDYRKKRIGKDLDKQMMKHLELLCINAELLQITGSTSQKMQLIESLRKINNLYLVDD